MKFLLLFLAEAIRFFQSCYVLPNSCMILIPLTSITNSSCCNRSRHFWQVDSHVDLILLSLVSLQSRSCLLLDLIALMVWLGSANFYSSSCHHRILHEERKFSSGPPKWRPLACSWNGIQVKHHTLHCKPTRSSCIDPYVEASFLVLVGNWHAPNSSSFTCFGFSIMLAANDCFFAFVCRCYNNAYFAKVGGISLMEMNHLEIDFLFSIGFELNVTPATFSSYCSILRRELYLQSPPPPPPSTNLHCCLTEDESSSRQQKQGTVQLIFFGT